MRTGIGYWVVASVVSSMMAQNEAVDIGSRLELFVDSHLVDALKGAELRLQTPIPAETVLKFDQAWEGRYCGYVTVFKDDDRYRMYYRGLPSVSRDASATEATCYAESADGIQWQKPDLGLYQVQGTLENNVVLANIGPFTHNFAPFCDTRPGIPPSEQYKALAGTGDTGLAAFVSDDGLHWKKLREEPVIIEGAFDSQNVAFWSENEGCYCCYFRTWDQVRRISRCTSPDFLTWSEPVLMEYGNAPLEHLYTNQTTPYFRAPHIYIAFAARFMPGRQVVSEETAAQFGIEPPYSGDCSEGVFMTTRGGNKYDRTFLEAFVRPGIGPNNWTSRTNYPACGIVSTGPDEISFYVQRNYGQPGACLQRFRLRLDGFVSVHAPYSGGEMITKPLVFKGTELVINFSTSAAGSIRVEVQDAVGAPIEGFTQTDSEEIIGDEIERVVTWRGESDLSPLAGKPVRLHFLMKDADLFAIRFR